MPTQSIDPRTGEPFGPVFDDSTVEHVEGAIHAAEHAATPWAEFSPAARSAALRAVADALDAAAEDLVPLADSETGLGSGRLTGELARTTFQLRMFADLVDAGQHLGVVLDPAVPGAPPAGHPELRRMLVPLGPVAVFGASNFPFAFSVPGGDTASALAAGCPVVVKAHPGHPQTCAAVATIMDQALTGAGAPAGTFGIVHGLDAGRTLVTHPGIRAAAFTGSYNGGRALFDLAVSRPDPIPFYGELGSVNPVVITPAAARRGQPLAAEYVDSLTLGAGQFCTNPGLLLLPSGSGLTELVVQAAAERDAGILLHAGVAEALRSNIARLTDLSGVRTLLDRADPAGQGFRSGPVILAADPRTASEHLEILHTECFGPAAVLVEYDSEVQLLDLVEQLDGCLVATVHGDPDEPLAAALLPRLARRTGRLVWNGWPTGVAVTAGMQHGGPYPATTNPLHTSVGTAAVSRFLRPITYQSVPTPLLPSALR